MLATDLHIPQANPRPRKLPSKLTEQLAICARYPDLVLFLDVETTGLSHYYDEITIVGWSIGGQPTHLFEARIIGTCRRLRHAPKHL